MVRPEEYIKFGPGIDASGTRTGAAVYDLENNAILCKTKVLTAK